MRRVLLQWNGLRIHSYPAMLATGIVAGMFVQQSVAARMHLVVGQVSLATLLLLIPALLGSRLLFVLSHWSAYRSNRAAMYARNEGGGALYGGLLLAVPVSVPLLAALAVPFWRFWDSASFTMLAGMAITRAGCFLNGCCAGRPTNSRFGMYLPNHLGVWARRVPNQLLEAASAALLLAAVFALQRTSPAAGVVFLATVCGYGAVRALLEAARETQDRAFGLRLQRALSLGLVSLSLAVLITAWRN